MAYRSDDYRPNERSRAILARAWAHVQSVPYQVTARWLFYRLLQDGYYRTKIDYNNRFLPLLSRARHNDWGGWRPDTLADDRREAIVRGNGFSTPRQWAAAMAQQLSCNLDRWETQPYYCEVWFEAEAMKAQFEYYTRQITLRPFSGMPSIPFKWEIAKALEQAWEIYCKPIIVLYFGDLDAAGEVIPETTVVDIRGWCDVDFEFVRAGLNPGDELRYNIPESIDHPGAYQWEALNDEAARQLITGAVARYVDYDAMAAVGRREDRATALFRESVADLAWKLAEV